MTQLRALFMYINHISLAHRLYLTNFIEKYIKTYYLKLQKN